MLSSRRQLIALSFDLWFTSAKIGVLPSHTNRLDRAGFAGCINSTEIGADMSDIGVTPQEARAEISKAWFWG